MKRRLAILSGLRTIPLVDPSLRPEVDLLDDAAGLSRWRLLSVVRCGEWRLARAAVIALACLWDARSARVLWQRVFHDGWRDPGAALYVCDVAFALNRDRWWRREVHTALRRLQTSQHDAEREFLLRVLHLCGLPPLGERWRQVATAEALRALHEPWASAHARGAAVDLLAAACSSREPLVAALDHPEPEVRRRAAAAFGNRPMVTDDLVRRLLDMAANDHEASAGIALPVSRTARAALARIEYRTGAWAGLLSGTLPPRVAETADLCAELRGALSLLPPHSQLALRAPFDRLADSGSCSYGGLRRLLAGPPGEHVETAVRAIGCLELMELVPDLWQVALGGESLTAEVRQLAGVTAHRLDERQTPPMADRIATALLGRLGPARQEAYLRLLAIVAWVLPDARRADLATLAANCVRDAAATPAAKQAARELTEALGRAGRRRRREEQEEQ
jgi:hypothetical protein